MGNTTNALAPEDQVSTLQNTRVSMSLSSTTIAS
jgi:hypothetical protein